MSTIRAHTSEIDPELAMIPQSPVDAASSKPPVSLGAPATAFMRKPIGAQIPQGRLSRWYDKIEAFVSQLSTRDNFWHRICSLIWLPYAFFSGIQIKPLNADTYAAILPFRRFNRNW